VTSWTSLGEVTAGRDSGSPTPMTTFRFGTADSDGVYPGIAWNWIKFKFEFNRGATVTNTPLMAAAVLHFVKVRDNTPNFTCALRFDEESPDGRSAEKQKSDLRALLEADRFVNFRTHDDAYGVWVTGLTGGDGHGDDETGTATLSLLAVQSVEA
jgi:hypothetical protein